RSRPASRWSRVLFPEPLGPRTTAVSPASTLRSTPLSTSTSVPAVRKRRNSLSHAITAGTVGTIRSAPDAAPTAASELGGQMVSESAGELRGLLEKVPLFKGAP